MTRSIKSLLLVGAVGMSLMGASMGRAHADIFPTLKTVTNLGDGTFRWTYDADVNDTQKVMTGDFFTIYDFAGLVTDPGHLPTQPAGWTFSTANSGVTPSFLISPPIDNLGIPNLTWTYSGADKPGAQDLGLFSAVSIFDHPTVSDFASQATEQIDQIGLPAGSKADNVGWIPTPAPGSVVPEPCTMALLSLGAAPLLGSLRRRSRKA